MSNEAKKDQHDHVDHRSDPAHTPGDGWADEGGASHLGPATHTKSDQSDNVKPETEESDES